MTNETVLDRIEIDPARLRGRPVIRGTRLAVDFILGLLAQGATAEELQKEYTGLQADDIRACLLYASHSQ